MSVFDMLTSFDALNTELEADPDLAFNMAEMGFIKRVPFQRDHNDATVSKWDWTDYGRREMMERLDEGARWQLERGRAGKQ